MNTVIAGLPILLLMWAMTKRNAIPSHIALPVTALLIALIQWLLFEADLVLLMANVVAGILSVLTPISIVAGAILLNRVLHFSGAEAVLSQWLKSISRNKVAQLMIIGWAFAFMIEGASGFGTPAAIAAPILVGLGFPAIPVAIFALVMNSVPVSFGAVGTPIWFGLSGLSLSETQLMEIARQTALLNSIAALVIPFIALRFLLGWQEIRHNAGFILLSVLSCTLPYMLFAQWNYEFPALIGGAIGLALNVWLAKKRIGLSVSTEVELPDRVMKTRSVVKVFVPFALLIVILIVTRVPQWGIKEVLNTMSPLWGWQLGAAEFEISKALVLSLNNILGTGVSWQYKSLYVPAVIPFLLVVLVCVPLFGMSRTLVMASLRDTGQRLLLPMVSLMGALVMVNLMMQGGSQAPMLLLAQAFAGWLGDSWGYAAALLGALGSFFSGSATVSNLTFGGIQLGIAEKVGLPITLVLALQSAGAAMGNMVCINNIIAVSTILGVSNKEGFIIKRTIIPMLAYALVAALFSLVWLH
ncbi:L-lactate permease [Marinomonas sp. M1K-6]|uniref:L-lactate permease n=1 Tax=Marinomonas profundi TaxID=2726122 RepID=A0A847R5U7_9GAMM|nr:L-lactate permease [Marinomonas profundi]NLQ16244.1 L-lactate permease [Marinomonas profundi]UDV03179.1 L-lactate permease [Marinomonas profundi]